MRWGMPPPPRTGGPPVTNIRNTSSPQWRGWLKPENRCLVPANSFAEYAPEPNPETKKKDVVCSPSMRIVRYSRSPGYGTNSKPIPVRIRSTYEFSLSDIPHTPPPPPHIRRMTRKALAQDRRRRLETGKG
jgi:hypothetical protein